jgi:hypothetical protein
MNHVTAETIIQLALFLVVVVLVKIISEHLLKRRVLSAHLSADQVREFAAWMRGADRDNALKWGLVWIGIGAALVLADLLPVEFTDPVTYGMILILGGAGLLFYRALVGRGNRD